MYVKFVNMLEFLYIASYAFVGVYVLIKVQLLIVEHAQCFDNFIHLFTI